MNKENKIQFKGIKIDQLKYHRDQVVIGYDFSKLEKMLMEIKEFRLDNNAP